MSKYYVLTNLKHDGKNYEKGDYVDLPEGRGAELERDGVVTSKEQVEKPVDQSQPEPTDPAEAQADAEGNAGGNDSGEDEASNL